MMSLALPWALLALPLPLLARLLRPASQPIGAGLRVPFFAAMRALPARPAWRPRLGLAHLVWLLLVLAAAQPQWLGPTSLIPTSGRDLMLVVDISGSMRAMDFAGPNEATSRLDVVKMVATRFIVERRGDRLGLILFGGQPHLRVPLTHDRTLVATLLDEADIGLAGEHTAVGDAVALAIKAMRDRPPKGRVIVLLTDGVSNAGTIGPQQAARLAAAEGFRIHTIGMGRDDGAAPNLLGTWGSGGARDFNRAVLEDIARITGGTYSDALDRKALDEAWTRVAMLEPSLGDEVRDHLSVALYPVPLAMALLISAALAWRAGRRREA